MFDAVFNHTSSKHKWFQSWLKMDPQYENYYHHFNHKPEPGSDDDKKLSMVVRPRTSNLLEKFKRNNKDIFVWATFSADQLDVNFSNPKVLLEFVDLIILYLQQGAKYLRIDAVPFLWKELGTSCVHLPQTHILVKLFRSLIDLLDPRIQIVTESNVPHKENISYFGDGTNEAQMVYNFTLAPLILHSILKEDSFHLKKWVNSLESFHQQNYFFNFTATHDGIGVRPLENILEEEDILNFADLLKSQGGLVSYREFEGKQKPYEINITWASALTHPQPQIHIDRIILSYAMSFVFPGVPGVYFHNLVGTLNWDEGYKISHIKRDLNRRMFCEKELKDLIRHPFHGEIYKQTLKWLHLRRKHKVFHPQATFVQKESSDNLWVVERQYQDQKGLFIFNLSSKTIDVPEYSKKTLAPYQFLWIFDKDTSQ